MASQGAAGWAEEPRGDGGRGVGGARRPDFESWLCHLLTVPYDTWLHLPEPLFPHLRENHTHFTWLLSQPHPLR